MKVHGLGMSQFHYECGNHICLFYRHPTELLYALVPYIADGLRKAEQCVCLQRKSIIQVLIYRLQFLGIDTDRAIRRGALELHVAEDIYLTNRKFQPDNVRQLIERRVEDSTKRGFQGFRGAGDLSWAAGRSSVCHQLVSYEEGLQAYCPGRPVTLMCQYQQVRFEAEVLKSVLQAHQFSITETQAGSTYVTVYTQHGVHGIDIVGNRHPSGEPFNFVVRHKSGTILGWGSEATVEAARGKARSLLAANR